MKKTITTIMLGVFLISLVSAISINSGECYNIELPIVPTELGYLITGNSSNMDGMNISMNNNNVSLCFDKLYESDNFTLILIDKSNEEIIKEVIVNSGGGGSSIRYVDRNVTEYVPVETLKYLDYVEPIGEQENENTSEIIETIPEETKDRFFQRIWDWIRGLFKWNTRR